MYSQFKKVTFISLAISALGVFASESSALLTMLAELGFDDKDQKYVIRNIMNIAIRTTYYIFCSRNKDWRSPELMNYYHDCITYIF